MLGQSDGCHYAAFQLEYVDPAITDIDFTHPNGWRIHYTAGWRSGYFDKRGKTFEFGGRPPEGHTKPNLYVFALPHDAAAAEAVLQDFLDALVAAIDSLSIIGADNPPTTPEVRDSLLELEEDCEEGEGRGPVYFDRFEPKLISLS